MIDRPDTIPTAHLQKRFVSWCCNHGAGSAVAAALGDSLCERYQEPHRHYHHLGHLASSLAELDRCGEDLPLIEGAIWFHDVIYDPTRADNESASIAWFRNATGSWLTPEAAAAISSLIEATDFRTTPADDPEVRLMIDIDLAILSAEPDTYDAYRHAIRQEYSHVGDEAFLEGRTKVMGHFMANPIYRTAAFFSREEQARANISLELARLGGEDALQFL